MNRTFLAALAAALILPASAQADPAGSTLLQSRPDGLATWLGGDVNHSSATRWSTSADGCRVVFDSTADGLSAADDDARRNVYLRDVCAGETTLISAAGATPANDDSSLATISPDGRYVAFISRATNLGGGVWSAYLHDTQSGTSLPVSRATGTDTAHVTVSTADAPTVSNDGKVAFMTAARLTAEDVNDTTDVYLRSGTTTTLVSRNGANAAGEATAPAISADGTAVAFVTRAAISGDDTNTTLDVYVQRGAAIELISRDAAGAVIGYSPVLDADGSAVAFQTTAAIDAQADTNRTSDVYLRSGGTTQLVSRRDGEGSSGASSGSFAASIDATGRRVAFLSDGGDFGQDLEDPSGRDAYLRDMQEHTTEVLSTNADGTKAVGAGQVALAATGGHAVMVSSGRDFLPGSADDFSRVLRRTLPGGATELVSRPAADGPFDGGGVNGAASSDSAVSADGRYVAFVSSSDALAPGGAGGAEHAYVRDNRTDTTVLVSRATDGTPANAHSADIAISDDGRRVAFMTAARLHPDDTDAYGRDIYVHDLDAETTVLASRRSGGAADNTATDMADAAISGDGTRVAFTAVSSLVGDADANSNKDVYVHDLASGDTLLASGAATGAPAERGSLDEDGSMVAYETTAPLDAAKDSGTQRDIYRRDLGGDAQVLVSRADGAGTASGNGPSNNPSISADGSRVAFDTTATNLGDGHTWGIRAVHVRDVAQDKTVLASRAPDTGAQSNGYSERPSLSADGSRVAFESTSTNLGPGVNASVRQIWMHDLGAGENVLVSRAAAVGDRSSRDAAISAGGGCVAFTTAATNLGPDVHVPGDFQQVYLRAVDGHCPDEAAPDTAIDGGPEGTTEDPTPAFTFSADEDGATFQCRIGEGAWTACTSGDALAELPDGAHTFAVRAVDANDNADSTPAERTFTVRRPVVETPRDPQSPQDPKQPGPQGPSGPSTEQQQPGPQGGGSAQSGGSRLAVVGKVLRVSRKGRTTLRLRCVGTGDCSGRVTLTAKAGRKVVVVARGRLAAAPGATAKVKLRLSAAGRKAARRKEKVTVTVTGLAALKVRLSAIR